MDYKNISVLLPESSGRQALPMAKAFSNLGCRVTTVEEHKLDLGNVTRYSDEKYVVCAVDSDKKTAENFYDGLIGKKHFDIIVPLSDFSAGIFAERKAKIESQGNTVVATNELPIFMQAFDKLNTMKVCMEKSIPCPFTLDEINSIDDVPEDIRYPVIIKPRSSCGSIGLHIAHSRDELADDIVLLSKENLGAALVQEFIPQNGKQYNAHIVMDKNSEVKTAILAEKCRWFPLDGGASTLCRTIHNDSILNICIKLLKEIGWVGYCDIDLMEDPRDGSVKVIEINARISANVKLCFAAGINIAKQLLQLYFDEEVDCCTEYPDDVRLRCAHTDLLWFIKSPDRFKAKPSWFSCKHTHDQIFSVSDPLPFFTFSMQAIAKYKREMKKRKR